DILPLPEQAAAPSGPETVDTDETPTTVYATTGAANADTYGWAITPADAYTDISVDGMECTVTWAYPYTGPANISVKGMNDCGEGSFSSELNVTLENSFGIDELARALGLAVYPNPNKGSFTLELATTQVDKVNVRIVNAVGHLVYEKQDMQVNSHFSTNIDISGEAEGIYLMVVESDLGVHTGRIVIQK
ncbi:MAG: T9SS type A sorting domain-containing protein, partial [Bacteroidales bacterium]|nr:T9SS type A sorting domain-containing protein [Bacteroidales bacterium]